MTSRVAGSGMRPASHSSYDEVLTAGGDTLTVAPASDLLIGGNVEEGFFVWLRSTVTIIDLELRVLVAYRAADGVYGDVPPMRVFDELLDQRLQLMAASDRVNARRGRAATGCQGVLPSSSPTSSLL